MSDTSLYYRERPAAGEAEGLLVLHHGRGSDELDLLSLASVLDPQERLHVVAARAPMRLPGSPGYHWYHVREVGYPDHDSFHAAYQQLCELHDELWSSTGIAPERTVLGGFSMGTVMSYSTALGPERPAVAGVLAFSGFVPTVDGWEPDLPAHVGTRVFIGHGAADPVIGVEFAQRAHDLLAPAGYDVELREGGHAHTIPMAHLAAAATWASATFAGAVSRP
jgi:phospholipase/carboxylesterase